MTAPPAINPRARLVGLVVAGCLALLMAGCARRDQRALTLPTPGVSEYPQVLGASQDGANPCLPRSIQFVAQGGENSWSPDGERLAFQNRDADGVYQIYTIRPDGSDQICLTCTQVPGGPPVDVHKGFPDWHPGGAYIVVQVAIAGSRTPARFTEPGRGLSNDLWATSPDGQRWAKLTDYRPDESAVLNPRFSPDGARLLWAERTGRASQREPFGIWQLKLADVIDDGAGLRLANVQDLRPGDGAFYEGHGFSSDGQSILFTSDIGLPSPYGLDIFASDLAGGQLRNLTNDPRNWDEHANFSPSGARVSFISSRCCNFDIASFSLLRPADLRTETYVMNADGTGVTQITHFNQPGFPETQPDPAVAIVSSWSPDGTRLAIGQFLVGEHFDAAAARRLWVVTLQGSCG